MENLPSAVKAAPNVPLAHAHQRYLIPEQAGTKTERIPHEMENGCTAEDVSQGEWKKGTDSWCVHPPPASNPFPLSPCLSHPSLRVFYCKTRVFCGGVTMGTARSDLPLLEQSGLQIRAAEIIYRLDGFVLSTHTRWPQRSTHLMHSWVDCGR